MVKREKPQHGSYVAPHQEWLKPPGLKRHSFMASGDCVQISGGSVQISGDLDCVLRLISDDRALGLVDG